MADNHRREVIIEEDDLETARTRAAETLGCTVRTLRHEVLQEARPGFLGVGARGVKIRAWKHDPVSRYVDQALKLVGDLNGHFGVEISGTNLLLTVFPASGAGAPVDETTVYQEVMSYDPESIDEDELARAVAAADSARHVIGRIAHEGERDGRVEVSLPEDAMSATITLIPPKKGGADLSVDEVLARLARFGVTSGIDRELIDFSLRGGKYNVPIVAARGVSPEEGEPGRVGFTFRLDRHVINFKQDEYGRVDYREPDLVESVKRDQVLAQKIPAGRGTPGKNVRGEEIPAAPGREAELPAGVNVYADGDELRAGLDGAVSWTDNRVIVTPVLHVAGDVNYESGNIDFDGTVRVDGLIEDGFSVKARGSLFVKKSIGKCTIDVGGNLVVMGGIVGRSDASINVAGDLVALFIENSTVFVGKDLVVGETILHSEVAAAGNLAMSGGRAAVIGGAVSVGGHITVRTIGGEATTRTIVRAGVKPERVKAISALRAESAMLEDKAAKIQDALRRFEHRAEGETEIETEKIDQLRSTLGQIRARIKGLAESQKRIEMTVDQEARGAKVHVQDTAMAGTRIEIGGAMLQLTAPVEYATFQRSGAEIKFFPFNAK